MPTICWAEANALSQTSFLIEGGFFMLEMSTILYALVSFRLFSYLKMISAVFNSERGVYLMSRIGLLEDFDERKVRDTLNLLLRVRSITGKPSDVVCIVAINAPVISLNSIYGLDTNSTFGNTELLYLRDLPPTKYAKNRFKKILVPLDGSLNSIR